MPQEKEITNAKIQNKGSKKSHFLIYESIKGYKAIFSSIKQVAIKKPKISIALSAILMLALFSSGFLLLSKPTIKTIGQAEILKSDQTIQISKNVVAGKNQSTIKWISIVDKKNVEGDQRYLKVPDSAKNVKIKTFQTQAQVQEYIENTKEQNTKQLSIADRQTIAGIHPGGFFAKVEKRISSFAKLFMADALEGLENATEVLNLDESVQVQQTDQGVVVNLEEQLGTQENIESSQVSEEEAIQQDNAPAEEIVEEDESVTIQEEVLDETTVQEEIITDSESIITTTSPSSDSPVEESILEEPLTETPIIETTSTSDEVTTSQNQEEIIAVEFETESPVIDEQDTSSGKLVTVALEDESIDEQATVTDVVAYTTIPEFYKVGQENKIQIKWKNKGDVNVYFYTYDLDSNGYLDYVEWRVPHLSEQIFEIIFISKAFHLDQNKDIIADIFDTVKSQNDVWASLQDKEYVRVTFEKILSANNDITLFAKSRTDSPAQIEVYPVDENGNTKSTPLITFNIQGADMYKTLLLALDSPTDVFDLRMIGDIDIDYIIDPTNTFQDPYSNTTYIDSQAGSEVSGGDLINTNLDEGTVLDFNGSSHYIDIADSANLSFGNGTTDSAFSGSAWVKMDDATLFFILNKDDYNGSSGSNREYRFITNGSDLLDILVYDQSASAYISRTYSTALTSYQGKWIHLAFTYDGSSVVTGLKLYLNGSRVDNTSVTSGTYVAMENKSAALQIGGRSTNSYYSNGMIDDVRIFNSELTASQIQQIYATGENASTPQNWWKFNDGSGSTATDSGSGGNNGDLTGHAPTWTTDHQPFYATRSQTISTDMLSGLGATDVSTFKYTTTKKPGGSEARLQFSSDGSNWKNANGDDVTNSGGYWFDGSNDIITSSQTVATLMSNSTGTMSAWFKPEATGQDGSTLVFNTDGIVTDNSGYVGILYGTFNSVHGFHFYNWDGNADAVTYPISSANYGQWYHLTWVHSGGTLYAYVNGALVGSTSSGNTATTTGTFRIGANWTGGAGNDFTQGTIDDVRIYNIALTDNEIWALHSQHEESYNSTTGLEAWWKFDGGLTDSSGNGYTASLSGATSVTNWYDLPVFGEGATEDVDTLSFDGSNDLVTVPHNTVFNTGTGTSFTWTAWIKPQNQSQNSYIIGKRQSVNPYNFLLIGVGSISAGSGTSSKRLRFLLNSDSSNRIYAYTSSDVVDGNWHHVAFQRTGATTVAIYVDGVSVPVTYDAQLGNANVSNSYDLIMGSLDSSGTLPYSGKIANVAFYNTTLSASQILTDFQNGYSSTTNLVAQWPLNEGTGTAVDNAEGTSTYDGTTNGPTWIKDTTRPIPSAGSQQTIDISGLGFTSTFYYMVYGNVYQITPNRSYAFAEASVGYTGVGSATWLGINTNWEDTDNWDNGQVPDSLSDVTIADTANDPILTTNANVKSLTISSGAILDLAGYNLTIHGGSFSNEGTLKMRGNETLTGFTNDTDTGTITYTGTSSYTGLTAGNTYYNLTFDGSGGSWTLNNDLTVNQTLTITTGTLDASSSNYAISVAKNWSNSGTFTAQSGTVTLSGTSQTISGNTTFYNLTKTVASADTLTFTAGTTQTIAAGGRLKLRGAASNLLTLASSTTSAFTLTFADTTAKYVVDYVSVSYSTASGLAILALNSTDGGNNTSWSVATTSGTLRYWVSSSSGNWNDTANWSTTSGGSGGSSVPTSTGDAIFDGSSNGDVTVNATVSVKGLYLAGYSGTFSQGSYAITIGTDGQKQGTAIFTGGTNSITLNGLFLQIGGTINFGNQTINANTSWTYSGGTLSAGSSTVIFSHAFSATLTITGNQTLNNVTFTKASGSYGDGSITIASGATLTVTGTLTFTHPGGAAKAVDINTGTIAAQGNISLLNTGNYNGSATLLINGTGDQTFSGDATLSSGGLMSVNINKPSGTLTLSGSIVIGSVSSSENTMKNANWTYTAGTVDAGSSTIIFSHVYSGTTIITGSHTLYNVTFSKSASGYSSGGFTIASGTTLTTTGTLTFDTPTGADNSIDINTGTLEAQGDVTIADSGNYAGTATLQFTGTANQTYTNSSGGTNLSGTITINKSSGTVTLTSNASFNASGQDLTLTSGTLDLAGYNLSVTDQLTVGSSGTLKLQGGETITGGPDTLSAGSSVIYNGTSTYASLPAGNSYSNLTFDGSGGTWSPSSTLTVSGALTITNGTLNLAGQNLNNTSGTFSNTGTLKLQGGETLTAFTNDVNSGTVTYTGTSSYASLIAGNTYNHLTFDGSGGSWTLNNALTVNGNLTITNGTLDTKSGSNYGISVAGNWSNSGTFTARAGTVTLGGTNQKIFDNNTFYSLTKDISGASADTLMFENTKTQTIDVGGTLTLTGALGKVLTLRSMDSSGTQSDNTAWLLTVNGTPLITYVDVKDSDASGGTLITQTNSTDSGNNENWGFNFDPTFSTITASSSIVGVGSDITFTSTSSDPDGGDTVTLYVCRANDFTGTACGAGGEWCHSSASLTDASCLYTIVSGDGSGSQIFYANIIDSHNAQASDNPRSSTFETDISAPIASSFLPIDGATTDTNPLITFALNSTGDCRLSFTDESYDDMSGDTDCMGDNTTSISCRVPDQSPNTYTVYISCKNSLGNKNTTSDNFSLTYAMTQVSSGGTLMQIINLPTTVINTIAEQLQNLVATTTPEEEPTEDIIYPPIEESVPKETPQAFKEIADLIKPSSPTNYSVLPLPKSVASLINKFPQIENTLDRLGIAKSATLPALRSITLNLPSLDSLVPSLRQNIKIANLPEDELAKIPSNIVFVNTAQNLISLNTQLAFSEAGEPLQFVKLINNQQIDLVLKTDQKAEKIIGSVILKSVKTADADNAFDLTPKAFSASILDAIKENSQDSNIKELVLSTFEYTKTDNGIYTASLQAPSTAGNYEIKTDIIYQDNSKDTVSTEAIIDPEGYIYHKTFDGQQTRIKDAIISLYKLNNQTQQYELWNAGDYLQQNPQTTDITGKYSFLVPEGNYYLKVESKSFKTYKGEPFTVQQGIAIHQNIELASNWLTNITQPSFIILIASIIVLIGIIITFIGILKVNNLNKKQLSTK